ncbi:hypothetical protein D3C75_158850 [compost metagenome]
MKRKPARRKLYDNYEYVGEVKRADNSKLEVSLVSQRGVKHVNIREFYLKEDAPEWLPSGKGVLIPILIPIGDVRRAPAADIMLLISKAILLSTDFPLEGVKIYKDPNEVNRF